MTEREIEKMDGQPVLVLTHSGMPVSLGRLRISQPLKPRIELLFETETMACALGIPLERAAILHASFDGSQYRHRLPEGDAVWLPHPHIPVKQEPPTGRADLVETYPLPPSTRLIGPSMEELKKPTLPDDPKRK
jgi:hypothetical protein